MTTRAIVATMILATVGTASADERALAIPELAAPAAPLRIGIAVDDARLSGGARAADGAPIRASSQALLVSLTAARGAWVPTLDLGAMTWQGAVAGAMDDGRGTALVSPTLGLARWFGAPRRDGGAQLVVRSALTVPIASGSHAGLPYGQQLRATAAPWGREGAPNLKLAIGARLAATGVFALQLEAGADLGVTSGDHGSWAHGLVFVGGGAALRASDRVVVTAHALARWLPTASPWRRDDEGAVAGLGAQLAVGPGQISAGAEVRVDGCPIADAAIESGSGTCTRVVLGYSQPLDR